MTTPSPQPRNPLHGITLEAMLTTLVATYGWAGLGERIALRCFTREPTIASSLKVLRKTPWAREKVERLYVFMVREMALVDGRQRARSTRDSWRSNSSS